MANIKRKFQVNILVFEHPSNYLFIEVRRRNVSMLRWIADLFIILRTISKKLFCTMKFSRPLLARKIALNRGSFTFARINGGAIQQERLRS